MNFKRIFLALLLPAFLSAQSTVDNVVNALDSLATVSLNDWRMSPNLTSLRTLKGDPTQQGFDDSQWEILKIGQWVYPDSCWLRKIIILPEKILGESVQGKVNLLLSVDDYGYLWVNGEAKGYFPWDGEFELTKNAKPGDRFVLAIKAVNTGGPMRLLRAALSTEAAKSTSQLIQDLSLSLRSGQKLLSFDTYQTSSNRKTDPGVDKSTSDRIEKENLQRLLQSLSAQIDIEALRIQDIQKFKASVDKIRPSLKPISDFARKFTLVFASNAHIDAAWLWRSKETIEVCKNTFSSVLSMMDSRPDLTYTQSSAAYYDWMERFYPDVYRRIEQRVADGRWETIGGMWVEPDCNLISGESWMHHLLYGKKYFSQKLKSNVTIGWNPDSFGYNWNMPQFYREAGIDAFITQKIGWNATNVFPYRLFWWESPDGSRILSYFPFDYVNEISNPYTIVDWMRQFEANTGMKKMLVLFGVGDHGGGPTNEMLARVDRLRSLDIYPTVEYSGAAAYIAWLKSTNLSGLPVWRDELYLEYHQGTYTTQARMKQYNRSNENLLTETEKFSTLASLSGRDYNRGEIEDAWRKVMFNQFHDILPGSGIREVYIDASDLYREAEEIADHERKDALRTIAATVNTSKSGKNIPLLVFNSLSWERNDLAVVDVPEEYTGECTILNESGIVVPSQTIRVDLFRRQVLFIAEKVPALGYKMYQFKKQKPTATASTMTIDPQSLENQFFKITLDTKSGWVKSITDKRNGREILNGLGNRLQLLEDRPSAWDAWNIGLTGTEYPSNFRKSEIVEFGPVRIVLRVYRDYRKPGTFADYPTREYPTSFFTQDIILYSALDRIDFRTAIDWWEDKTMLKVAFPVSVSDTLATYEIPYGSIQRSTLFRNSWDSAKVEVPASRWADLSQNDYGISLLNNSKYGYDIKGNTIRLSLLRSPKWPDATADRRMHTIDYSLYPHERRWNSASTVQRGYEFNAPLIALLTGSHKGMNSPEKSFASILPSKYPLTVMKKAENSDAWIVQWYDSEGRDGIAELTLPTAPKKVVRSDFLENDGEEVPVSANLVKVKTPKNGIVTLKIYY